jgi:hypothetical protein
MSGPNTAKVLVDVIVNRTDDSTSDGASYIAVRHVRNAIDQVARWDRKDDGIRAFTVHEGAASIDNDILPLVREAAIGMCSRCQLHGEPDETPDGDGVFWHRIVPNQTRECNASHIWGLYQKIEKLNT